jgi:hypothetical protein
MTMHMAPFGVRLTAEQAKAMLEDAGATSVAVVGRGLRMLAFFEFKARREAWVIRGNGWVRNFANDVARELRLQ